MADTNGYGDAFVPYEGGYTIDELIDLVQNELTISCALPKTLPDANIRQVIETRALPWFYRNYQYAVQKIYYFIDKRAFFTEEYTKYNYVTVPCEIQTVVYLYEVRNESLFQLGINTPNLSVNLGVTNQPYLSSYVTTIGELGVYKTMIDSIYTNNYLLTLNLNIEFGTIEMLTYIKEEDIYILSNIYNSYNVDSSILFYI